MSAIEAIKIVCNILRFFSRHTHELGDSVLRCEFMFSETLPVVQVDYEAFKKITQGVFCRPRISDGGWQYYEQIVDGVMVKCCVSPSTHADSPATPLRTKTV